MKINVYCTAVNFCCHHYHQASLINFVPRWRWVVSFTSLMIYLCGKETPVFKKHRICQFHLQRLY